MLLLVNVQHKLHQEQWGQALTTAGVEVAVGFVGSTRVTVESILSIRICCGRITVTTIKISTPVGAVDQSHRPNFPLPRQPATQYTEEGVGECETGQGRKQLARAVH